MKQASLRYKEQGFELDVPWTGQVDDAALAGLLESFHSAHQRIYGFSLPAMPIEIVTLRVDAIGMLPQVRLPELPDRGPVSSAVVGVHRVAFAQGQSEVPIYDRNKLGRGACFDGPAIITQLDATTLILPGQAAEVDKLGSIVVREK
jgi:N-methylhydantoinase A